MWRFPVQVGGGGFADGKPQRRDRSLSIWTSVAAVTAFVTTSGADTLGRPGQQSPGHGPGPWTDAIDSTERPPMTEWATTLRCAYEPAPPPTLHAAI